MHFRKILTTVLATLISSFIFAQNITVSDSSSKWKLGFNIGGAFQESDIKSKVGSGLGVTLERVLIQNRYSPFGLSLRGRYLYAHTYGKDYTKSTAILNNPALTGQYDPAVDYTGLDIFQNYKSKKNELSLEAMIIANRLRQRGVLLYMFGGLGFTGFSTYTDQLDANGNMYNYSTITGTSKAITLSQLDALRDGTYESKAENNGQPQWVFAPSWGGGIGFYLSPRTTIGFEHKITYPRTDLLDGQQWGNNNVKTTKNDIYHYTLLAFRFNLGGGRSRGYSNNKTYTNNYASVKPQPDIIINQPVQNPSPDCKVNILATITNIDSKQNITVKRDGILISQSLYDYQSANGAFSLYMDIFKATTISITVVNSAGNRTKYVTFNCTTPDTYTTVQQKPVVNITMPSQNPFVTSNCNIGIMATIENITGKSNIEVKQDGQIINSTLYDYNTVSKILTLNTIITGTSTFSILAKNNVGSDLKTTTIQCQKSNTRIAALPLPVISILRPATNPFVTTICKAEIVATIENITGKNNIEVKQNGSTINSALYSYDTGTKILSLNSNMYGVTSFTISATNTSGRDEKSFIIKCEPAVTPVVAKPIITVIKPQANPHFITDCIADISAVILNIDGKQNIEVRQNDLILNSVLYSYDQTSKVFSLNAKMKEVVAYTITAVNSAGKESVRLVIKCEPTPPTIEEKITICHYPPGNTGNPQTITIPKSALKAHLDHGDKIGECAAVVVPDPADEKITICHYPPGNKDNPQTITISKNALKAHLDHGDKIGECTTSVLPDPADEKITICHYPPGNKDNPQTITISKNALKAHLDHGDKIGECTTAVVPDPADEKITICHYPPGNKDNPQTITISKNALKAHLDHGDKIGECTTAVVPDPADEKITICHYPPGNKDNPQTITIFKNALKAHLDHGDKIGECTTAVVPDPADEKITICHYPPGNKDNPQTITISKNALKAHLDHGDKIGECSTAVVVPDPAEEKITICHYPPGNKDNPQTITISKNALKAHLDHGDKIGECTTEVVPDPAEEKITICHYPPGNTGNPQTITISKNALKAHLDHGDKIGECATVVDPGKDKTNPVDVEEEKITICHYPPGNTGNPQTLTISKNALKAHLDHGDKIGTCDEVDKAKKDADDKAANDKAAKDASDKAAADKAKKDADDKAAADKATKDAADKATADKAKKDADDKAANDKAAKDAADKAAADKAKKDADDKATNDKAAKDAADKAAADKAKKDADDKAAADKAAKDAADKKAAADKATKDAADKAAADKAAKDAADKKAAADKAKKDADDKAAADKAKKDAEDNSKKAPEDKSK